jgi:hypothetical protein
LVSSTTLTNFTAASQRDGWVHVTGVFEPAQFMRLNIDGEIDVEQTTGVPTGIDLITTTPFTIGRLNGSTTHSFNGSIDDVRVYDHALSLAEIQALVAMAPVGLDGDFNFDNVVDAADYVVWRKTLGDVDNYNLWRSNFGSSIPGSGSSVGAAAVPEPSSLLLIAAMALAFYSQKFRPRWHAAVNS